MKLRKSETVKKTFKKIDKKGTPYLLISSIPKASYYENWNLIKKFLKL